MVDPDNLIENQMLVLGPLYKVRACVRARVRARRARAWYVSARARCEESERLLGASCCWPAYRIETGSSVSSLSISIPVP